MAEAPFIPADPAELTQDWLSAVLAARFPHSHLSGVHVDEVGAGYGFVSRIARIELTWDPPDPKLPRAMYAKLPSREWMTVAQPAGDAASGVYLLEVAFYMTLAAQVPVAVPACHHAAVTASGIPFVLLLEAVQGVTVDQLQRCPRERADEVVDALAQLHAAFWERAGPERIFWLPGLDHDGYRAVAARVDTAFDRWLELSKAVVFDGWGQELDPQLPDRVVALASSLRTRAPACFDALAASGPHTLVHGDVRLDNLVFTSGGPCLLDWQLVKRFLGAYDLAYFLAGSLPVQDRRLWEQDLVARYHERLLEHGVTGYSAQQCWDDYRRSMILAAFAAMALNEWPESTERGHELLRLVLGRHWTFVLDHDSAGMVR